MACTISIDWQKTRGVRQSGVLQHIHVEGSAANCSVVEVTITCGSVALAAAKTNVGATGVWAINVGNLPSACQCGGSFMVQATCADGRQNCENADKDAEHDLVCIDVPAPVAPCPGINWQPVVIGACDNAGERKVDVKAVLVGGGNYAAELRDQGNNLLDSNAGVTPFTLSGSNSYPGNTSQTFSVVVTKPAACSGSTNTVTIPTCQPQELPKGSGSWGKAPDVPPGGIIDWPERHPGPFEPHEPPKATTDIPPKKKTNKCGSMVWIVAALLALATSLTALTLAWYFCVPGSSPPVWVWGSVVGVGLAAGVAIATWYVLCALVPDCECPTKCDWLQIGTMTSFAAFAILAWLSTCCPTIWLAVAFGAAYAAALASWVAVCKPSICIGVAAHLVALASGAAPAIAYIMFVPQIAACGSTIVNAAIATVIGLLGLATAASCIAKGN